MSDFYVNRRQKERKGKEKWERPIAAEFVGGLNSLLRIEKKPLTIKVVAFEL